MKCIWAVCPVPLPEDVQYAMYRTVPGLENVKLFEMHMQLSTIVSMHAS